MSQHSKGRGKGPTTPDVIAGAVVHHLVERSEREIDLLRQELETARRQAEEDEAHVARLPGALPPPRPAGGLGEADVGATPPRTTVVTRGPGPAVRSPGR